MDDPREVKIILIRAQDVREGEWFRDNRAARDVWHQVIRVDQHERQTWLWWHGTVYFDDRGADGPKDWSSILDRHDLVEIQVPT